MLTWRALASPDRPLTGGLARTEKGPITGLASIDDTIDNPISASTLHRLFHRRVSASAQHAEQHVGRPRCLFGAKSS